MNDKQVVRTLLLEAHRCVADAAANAAAKIGLQRQGPAPSGGDIDVEALLEYPPNHALSPEEEHALRSMKLSVVERAAIQKLIADASAATLFHFFNLIDATGEPEVKPPPEDWLGAWIVAPKDDRDREMLHDEFFDSHAEYERLIRRKKA